MTQLLEKALAELRKLSQSEQDAIATLILEELADEKKWDDSFSGSQDQLARLATKVREDIREGRIRQRGIDEL
jgi:hypothetical protein